MSEIRTLPALQALPLLSVIEDQKGTVFQALHTTRTGKLLWAQPGQQNFRSSEEISLPATLFRVGKPLPLSRPPHPAR